MNVFHWMPSIPYLASIHISQQGWRYVFQIGAVAICLGHVKHETQINIVTWEFVA